MKELMSSLVILSLLSGCASIVEGDTQDIRLTTNPPAQVSCDATNALGRSRTHTTPGQVMVNRSHSDLLVRCEGDGYAGSVVNPSDMESWVLGNIVLGGVVIGGVIDAATGAFFSYDDAILVPLRAKSEAASGVGTHAVSSRCTALDSDNYGYAELVECGAIVGWTEETRHLIMPK